MESYTKLAIVTIVLVATLVTGPMTTNGFLICGVTSDCLQSCQPAVAKGVVPLPQPTTECCSGLTKADMPCFCKLKDSALLSYYKIDPKEAMDLPTKCNLPLSTFHC